MSVLVPEIVLYKLLTGILQEIREDWNSHQNKSKTLIGHIFDGIKDTKNDYFDQASDLFLREKDHPRLVDVRLFYDAQRAKIPTIHITMPQEDSGDNSIGVGEWGHQDRFVEDPLQGTETPIYDRRFNTVYQIVCTSDNHREVMIMYHMMRAMLISVFDAVSFAGLQNPVLSGQDLRIYQEIAPEHVFMRSINLRVQYDVEVPRFFDQDKITKIILGPGNPVNPPSGGSQGLNGQLTV